MPLRAGDPSRVGRYRLTARIGAGGMGVVYLGRTGDGSQLAIKVLRPELADDPEFRVRFGREVAALMRVRGACTVRVIEADTEAPSPFMVTEYAEGPTLAEYLDSRGPLDPDMLYGLATGLADALTAIHAAGVVHRDLKPSNVILGRDGPKVIDFGIAHALDATKVTRTGMMVGSAGFMAPEHVTGRVGQAADIFAWGLTVAHAATGRAPFGTGTAHAVLYRIVYDEPDIAGVPETLRPLVMAALAKDPQRRPAARDLLDQLTRPVILSAPTTGGSAAPAQRVLTETWSATEPNVVPRTRPERPSPVPRPRTDQPRFTPGPGTSKPGGSLLLEPGARRPRSRRATGRRRAALIAAPAVAAAAVIAMLVSLMTGHGLYFGRLTASQLTDQGSSGTVLATYPGQQQRGVFQALYRVIASGRTMVAIGSQTSDGLVRQQFFVSTDGGAGWRMAPIHGPRGGQAPLSSHAELLAGGPGGWLAVSPQSIWSSPDGTSWTLAATHGISPQLPGDAVWVITKTAQGYLAAGPGKNQAVIWTSRDGLNWQRMTAAQLGLAGPGETVRNISYASYHGNATLISGQVAGEGTTYYGTWLSTDGGLSWTRVLIPADHGAGPQISGLGFDAKGLIAVRAGVTASGAADGVAYFSPNGRVWQYAGTIGPDPKSGGWSPVVVKGSDYGFVATGSTRTGKIVAYTSTGTGGTWQPTGSLGKSTAESVNGVAVAPDGTVVAVGSASRNSLGQRPVFVAADPAGNVRHVSVSSIPGGVVPELSVNGLAAAGGQLVAVGSADGYPAVWRKAAGGNWSLVTPLSLAAAYPGLTALSSVTRGPAGWLAVGVPGPVVLTSADGITWQRPGGNVPNLAGVPAVTVTSGPGGYVIAGKGPGPGTPNLWWSQRLTSWTSAASMNEVSGSSQVLAVAADGHGFLAVGSHNHQPTIWTASDGSDWTATVLGLPAGASSAVLQQVAVNGSHVLVLGQQQQPGGTVPLAEMSNNNLGWKVVPFSSPGPGTVFTALTAGPSAGFTAAAQYGPSGQQQAAVWTSADGMAWTRSRPGALTGGAVSRIAALIPSGSAVTGIGTVATQAGQRTVTVTLLPG